MRFLFPRGQPSVAPGADDLVTELGVPITTEAGVPMSQEPGAGLAPSVSAISPAVGSTAGGTLVAITVDNSSGATGATVGGIALTGFSIVDATTVQGTTGAHASGIVDVVVSNGFGSGTLVGGFEFV